MSDNTTPTPTVTTGSGVTTGVVATPAPQLDLTLEFDQQDTPGTWVASGSYHFMVGDNRQITLRLKNEPPAGSNVNWAATPNGNHSGAVVPITSHARDCTYTPTVTAAQRPVSGSRLANDPIGYSIQVTVTSGGQSHTATETIVQDERDIIRQEYLDFRAFRAGFNLALPTRVEIIQPTVAALAAFCNYNLVVDRGAARMYTDTLAALGTAIEITSAWRNPRRNVEVGGVTNSFHQTGRAVDMRAQNANSPTTTAVTRRHGMLDLYTAALGVAGRTEVLLEQGAAQLLPENWTIPQPSVQDPDNDGDGLPDNGTGPPAYPRNLRDIFDDASHVHGAI